jgi:hypothetical protein
MSSGELRWVLAVPGGVYAGQLEVSVHAVLGAECTRKLVEASDSGARRGRWVNVGGTGNICAPMGCARPGWRGLDIYDERSSGYREL